MAARYDEDTSLGSTYDNYDYDTSGTTYDTTGTTYDANAYDTYGTSGYGATGYGTTGYGTDVTETSYGNAYDTGYGTTAYDPSSGAYDQHLDYRTDGSRRHHRERLDPSGVYRHRDVDRRDDGTTHVHREYDNPNTGTSYHRDYER
ncbi:hypothetical protein N7462_002103 [Penicillium macrosclerotiorum]|uniref:uncharacterized protein n=1 Tax=Penicillium macrosclerotiorum TaxID=303699 RepID=UPI00254964B4|nr:uncharacterized protein N7462_002103 [Penicillium macrosclerotiorum]KAJ5692680.1 hypothetical protein N7462_002103 [Penicillium macrosclerotiorum]